MTVVVLRIDFPGTVIGIWPTIFRPSCKQAMKCRVGIIDSNSCGIALTIVVDLRSEIEPLKSVWDCLVPVLVV